jgi:prophage regulatory protein
MLPDIGYVRLHQIVGCPKRGIPAIIPVCRATWWAGVKSGRFPAGVLLGPRTRAWSVESIRALVAEMGGQG